MAVKLKKSTDFKTGSPAELGRQLSNLEDATQTAVTQLEGRLLPKLVPTNHKTGLYVAKEGEMVNTSLVAGRTILIQFPSATPKNAGQMIAVDRDDEDGMLIAFAPTGLINNAKILTLPATVGCSLFISDGDDWTLVRGQDVDLTTVEATLVTLEGEIEALSDEVNADFKTLADMLLDEAKILLAIDDKLASIADMLPVRGCVVLP